MGNDIGSGDTATLPDRLDQFVDQLWRPALRDGSARVCLRARPAAGWREGERYLVVPSAERATMLFPAGPRAATVGSLLNYRGLRRWGPSLQRAVLGGISRSGARLPFPILSVQLTDRNSLEPSMLPLATIALDLGQGPVFASMRVNLSSNRKPLLQVVDATGRSVGFAKFSWGPASVRAVRSERVALRAVGGRAGRVRAPGLLAEGEFYGRSYIVTAPIPLDSRSGGRGVAPVSVSEIFTLCPIVRSDLIRRTGQFNDLRNRLMALPALEDHGVVEMARDLLDVVTAGADEVPVATRWHGDLSSWNTARDSSGVLWCWDWESSEADAVAGLDALHRHFAERTMHGDLWNGAALAYAFEHAAPALVAAGTPRQAWGDVAGLYAATMVERACHLAAGPVGWKPDWVTPRHLHDLIRTARALIEQSRDHAR